METVSILQDGHQNGVAAVGFDKEGGVIGLYVSKFELATQQIFFLSI